MWIGNANATFQTLLDISNAFVENTLNDQFWEAAVGPPGSYMTERASDKIKRGDFLHLPYIGGTVVSQTLTPSPQLGSNDNKVE